MKGRCPLRHWPKPLDTTAFLPVRQNAMVSLIGEKFFFPSPLGSPFFCACLVLSVQSRFQLPVLDQVPMSRVTVTARRCTWAASSEFCKTSSSLQKWTVSYPNLFLITLDSRDLVKYLMTANQSQQSCSWAFIGTRHAQRRSYALRLLNKKRGTPGPSFLLLHYIILFKVSNLSQRATPV